MEFNRTKEALTTNQLEAGMRVACLAVTDLLEGLSSGNGEFLTLPFFYERLVDDEIRRRLPSALSILSTFEAAILEAHGYIDDPDDGQIHLDDDDFRDLINTGQLAHPETGQLINDPMRHVHLYYSVRKDAVNEA
jgi:hypothetical protein